MTALSTWQNREILERYHASQNFDLVRKFIELPPHRRVSLLDKHNRTPKRKAVRAKRGNSFDQLLAGIDRTLDVIGVFEVVALATGGTPRLRPQTESDLRIFLNLPEVRRYYDQLYPLATLFNARLSGVLPGLYVHETHPLETDIESSTSLSLLVGFFELDIRKTESKDLAEFLEHIDRNTDPTIQLLGLLSHSMDSDVDGERSSEVLYDPAFIGLGAFINFAKDYHRLVRKALKIRQSLGAAIWMQNGYWFLISSRLMHMAADYIEAASDMISTRVAQSEAVGRDLRKQRQVVPLRDLWIELSDWRQMSHPIVQSVEPLLDPWVDYQTRRRI